MGKWWSNGIEKYSDGTSSIPFGDPVTFPRFAASFANYRDLGFNSYITFLGESTIQGVGSSEHEPNSGSISEIFAKRMREKFGISISKYVLPPTLQNNNSAWSLGVGWIKASFGVSGRACIECPAGVATSTTFYDPNCGIEWDTITLQVLTYTGGGTFTVQATGGISVAGSCAGTATNSIALVVATAPKKSRYNAVTITPGSGQAIRIIGIKYSSSDTATTICISNAGVGGSRSDDFSSTINGLNGDVPPSYIEANVPPRLTFVCCGINDAVVSVSGATYAANMQTLITRISAYSDVVLLSPFAIDSSLTAYNATLADYENRLASLTGVNKFIPMYTETKNTYIERLTDKVHPTKHGYVTVADILWRYMTT